MTGSRLLTVMDFIEIGTGASLLLVPHVLLMLLLGAETAVMLPVAARVVGAALLSIGLTCWLGRHGRHAVAIMTGMLAYNLLAAMLLLWVG